MTAKRMLFGPGAPMRVPPVAARLLIDPPAVGWTVPQDPKFVYANGKTFIGWINAGGDAQVAAWDHASSTMSSPFTLHTALGGGEGNPDPHDSPAIHVRQSDGRLMVAYSAHSGSGAYLRISTNPFDATAFGAEVNLDSQLGGFAYTYMGFAELSAEGTIFLFYRDQPTFGNVYGPVCYSTSTDDGATWSAQTVLFTPNASNRAYRRMGTNGIDRIDIAATHKDPDPNPATAAALFHMYYEAGDWHASDGTVLTLPADKFTATVLLGAGSGSAWSAGFAYDGSGNPVSLTLIQHSTTIDVHQARWNGSSWDDSTIVAGLTGIYGNAYHPATMSREDPDVVWVSKLTGSHYELFRYTFDGATWTATAITSGSTVENTQPDAVWGAVLPIKVIWLHGIDTSGPTFNAGDWEVWGGY